MAESEDRIEEDTTLEFELTPDDLVRVTAGWVYTDQGRRHLSAQLAGAKRTSLIVAVVMVFATYGGLSFVYDLAEAGPRGTEVLFGIGLLSLLAGIGAYLFSAPKKSFNDRVAFLRAKQQVEHVGPGHSGDVRIRVGPDVFVCEDEFVSASYSWPVFRDIVCFYGYTVLILFDERALAIPDSAFETDGDRDKFIDECRDRNQAAGGIDAVVARFLSDRDFQCVGCKYQLRGVGNASCPECGRLVEQSDFRALVSPGLTASVLRKHSR